MSDFVKPPTLSTSFSESGKSAKKRFENILNIKAKKTGVLAFVLIVVLVGIIGTIVACNNTNSLREEKHGSADNPKDRPNLYYTMPHYSSMPAKALVGSNSWGHVQSNYPSPAERQFDEYLLIEPNSPDIPVWLSFRSENEKVSVPKILDAHVYLAHKVQEKIPIEIIDNSITFMPPKEIGKYIYSVVIKFEKGTVSYDIKIVVDDSKTEKERTTSGGSGYYEQVMEHMASEYIKTYSPHYDIVGQFPSNYKEKVLGDDFEATFFYKGIFKNYYKDPDTVGYIKEAKERGDKDYQIYYDEYNMEKEGNYDFRVTTKTLSDGKLDMTTFKLYTNVSPKGVEWQETKGFSEFIIGGGENEKNN